MVSKTDRLIKSMKPRAEIKAPIATDMMLPNHSGVTVHPEMKKIITDIETTYVPYTGATKDVDLGSHSLTTTGDINADGLTLTGNTELPNTTHANQKGIIYKDGVPFIHNFNYGNNGTVTTLGRNTFVGKGSGNFTMGSTATGNYQGCSNTAVGYYCLPALTTGYYNAAIGVYALQYNTSGSQNFACGYAALRNNTTGSGNVGFGYSALGAHTNGSSNFGFGPMSFIYLTSGSSNIGMGGASGRYYGVGSNQLTSLSNSILMGGSTKPLANGDTNEIVIGYNTLGKGSNTVTLGTTSTTDTHLEGNIHINGDIEFTAAGSGLPYADISCYDLSASASIPTATFTQMTSFDTNGVSNNCTPDHTNDHITITKAGRYRVNFNASFSGSGSVTWYGGVFKNNGATRLTNIQLHRKLGAAGDVGSAAASGIVDLAVNDTIELWFRQDSGVNKNIVIVDANLSVVQVGG